MQMPLGSVNHMIKLNGLPAFFDSFVVDVVPAMPDLKTLFAQAEIAKLAHALIDIPLDQFNTSLVVTKNVVRFPLKPAPTNPVESTHLKSSADGLRSDRSSFDYSLSQIFPSNWCLCWKLSVSNWIIAGLPKLPSFALQCLRRIQMVENVAHKDATRYAILHVDSSLFNSLAKCFYRFQILTSYLVSINGMSNFRRDFFLNLGLWHPYLYGHQAVWKAFRYDTLSISQSFS